MKRFFALLSAVLLAALYAGRPVQPALQAAALQEPQYVALTFDDGPRRDTTSALLDGLLERGAHATFFVIGQQIPGNEDLLLRMAEEGHQIGNHTYSHVSLQGTAEFTAIEEIHKTEVLLEELLGPGDYWLRPPYGLVDSRTSALVSTPMVYWSLDPEDWKKLDAGQVARQILQNVKSGDIVLLHDFYPTSVEAALQVIDALQGEGYVFLTVRELMEQFGTQPQAGALYASATQERSW